jgi:ribosomal-protein-alanine N-acetyltransferase
MHETFPKPGSGAKIISATWRDVKSLYDLERVCFEVDAWPLLDVIGVLTIPQLIRLKAIDQEKMVGFIAADLRRIQETAWIVTFAVLPEYRRVGVGSALLEACESQINLPRIRLSVRQSNQAAILLYKKYNYQHVDTWTAYYKGGDNALILEKTLPG